MMTMEIVVEFKQNNELNEKGFIYDDFGDFKQFEMLHFR